MQNLFSMLCQNSSSQEHTEFLGISSEIKYVLSQLIDSTVFPFS